MTEAWNGRPPAPLDEVDGWHFLEYADGRTSPRLWMGPLQFWARAGNDASADAYHMSVAEVVYRGPFLTPEQIEAKIAEAVKAEREAIAVSCDVIETKASREYAGKRVWQDQTLLAGISIGAKKCAITVRARGDTP